jgi:hypothetical protein
MKKLASSMVVFDNIFFNSIEYVTKIKTAICPIGKW